jgi:hypothetical protein
MLPELEASYTDNFSGSELADHIGTPKATKAPDVPRPPKDGATVPK